MLTPPTLPNEGEPLRARWGRDLINWIKDAVAPRGDNKTIRVSGNTVIAIQDETDDYPGFSVRNISDDEIEIFNADEPDNSYAGIIRIGETGMESLAKKQTFKLTKKYNCIFCNIFRPYEDRLVISESDDYYKTLPAKGMLIAKVEFEAKTEEKPASFTIYRINKGTPRWLEYAPFSTFYYSENQVYCIAGDVMYNGKRSYASGGVYDIPGTDSGYLVLRPDTDYRCKLEFKTNNELNDLRNYYLIAEINFTNTSNGKILYMVKNVNVGMPVFFDDNFASGSRGYLKIVYVDSTTVKIMDTASKDEYYAGTLQVNQFTKTYPVTTLTINYNTYIFIESTMVGNPATSCTSEIKTSYDYPVSEDGIERTLIGYVPYSSGIIANQILQASIPSHIFVPGACTTNE